MEAVHQAKRSEKRKGDIPKSSANRLAQTIYDQLKGEGYQARDVISISSQLVSLVTREIQGE